MKKVIVTGGLGFIGSNLIELLIKKKFFVINIDKGTYSSNKYNVKDFENSNNYKFIKLDINNKKLKDIFFKYKPQGVFNLAAETHVDRSIDNPYNFIQSNIVGVYNLLECFRKYVQKNKSKSLRDALSILQKRKCIGITPDGPRGPNQKASEGAIRISKISKVPIIPLGFASNKNFSLKSWDSFLITYPFSKCKFILVRQDPPFNLEYISSTYILDTIKNNVKIINDPTSIRNVSEKLYSSKFQKFMPKTIFTQDIHEVRSFFNKNKKIVIKPIHSFSGNDIHLIKIFRSKFISKFIKKHNYVMCQKFLPKIINGDKRVFLINGKVCGAISRIPKKGSFLSNMSKGAKPVNINLTKNEKKISNIVGKDLKKKNIFFAGIDFIDQKLNGDINITSPTGLKTFYDLSKINLAKTFWKELKA